MAYEHKQGQPSYRLAKEGTFIYKTNWAQGPPYLQCQSAGSGQQFFFWDAKLNTYIDLYGRAMPFSHEPLVVLRLLGSGASGRAFKASGSGLAFFATKNLSSSPSLMGWLLIIVKPDLVMLHSSSLSCDRTMKYGHVQSFKFGDIK